MNSQISLPMKTNRTLSILAIGAMLSGLMPANAAEKEPKPKPAPWPDAVRDIRYPSKADNTDQPAMWYASGSKEKRPLLVALHTWSGDYKQVTSAPYARWCIERDWVMIHPNFRGPNRTPEAMGSELAVQDILSAVDYAKANAAIDETRIYLVGVSGGGYGSLLLAGRAPELWAAVSAWVPISDIKAWHEECTDAKRKYAKDIELAVGGVPTPGSAVEEECRKRSALTYLPHARGVTLDINAGIHDGHSGSVPVSHTLNAFNVVANEADRLTEKQIDAITAKQKLPRKLAAEAEEDADYGRKEVLFRRKSGNARVTIFEGGHEIVYEAALKWLAKQRKR